MTSQNVSARRGVAVLGLSVMLMLVGPAMAADEYPSPGFFLGGLTSQSTWTEIQSKPGMKGDFPFVPFKSTFVALPGVCVDGEMLAIADPRIDTGVRVSAAELKAQASAALATGGYVTEPQPQLAAVAPTGAAPPVLRLPVDVVRFTERGFMRERVFLFKKLWPVPACPGE